MYFLRISLSYKSTEFRKKGNFYVWEAYSNVVLPTP